MNNLITNFNKFFNITKSVFLSFRSLGQLSVSGMSCEFSPGDRLYLRSRYLTDGSFGNWEYLVENEYSVSYRLSEFRSEDKVLVQSLF